MDILLGSSPNGYFLKAHGSKHLKAHSAPRVSHGFLHAVLAECHFSHSFLPFDENISYHPMEIKTGPRREILFSKNYQIQDPSELSAAGAK